jgi:flagellar hook-associated protein 3
MISRQYNSNLNRTTAQLNKAATTAYDNRAFEKPSEDPFLAGQTFQVRRQLALNENYTSNIENVKGAVSSAETAVQTVANVLSNAYSSSVLRGINGTSNQSDRNTIADQLQTMQRAIVSDMNAEYGNRYLFSGAGGGGQAPFSVDESGNLLYRGINVDTGENTNGASTTVSYNYKDAAGVTTAKSMQINFGSGIGDKLNGYTVSITAGGAGNSAAVDTTAKTISVTMKTDATKQDLQDYLQSGTFQSSLSSIDSSITADDVKEITISGMEETGADALQSSTSSTQITDMVDLDTLAGETSYVDVGLGMKTDENGKVIDQSAYNVAMPGINFLGYGTTTQDGETIPKNVYSLLGDMADILKDDSLSGEALMDKIRPYMDNFSNSQDELTAQQSQLGTNVNFLDSTTTYITNVNLNLTTRDESVEFVDSSDAITNYSMQLFSYQAALQVGSKILQPTLLDFMN